MITRRRLLTGAAAALAAPAAGLFEACTRRDPNTIRFFNWFNYIGKDTIANFQKETGIKVLYEVFSSGEEMFSKLKAGVRGYDLIVGTDYMIPRLKALQLIDPIPHELLHNLDNIMPRFRDPIYDPGLAYTVPYIWSTTGIGFNVDKAPIGQGSWWDLWDEKYGGRICMLDDVRDCVGCALLMLGLPTDTKDAEHLKKARDLLIKQRPLVKHYSSSGYVDDLTAGEAWLAQGWSGDVLQARRENKKIDYVVPKEGSFLAMDNLCLMRGSTNRAAVLRLVDHLLRPDVAADIAQTLHYPTPNQGALKLIDPEQRNDQRIYPSRAVEKRLRFHDPLDSEGDELWNDVWQEVKVL